MNTNEEVSFYIPRISTEYGIDDIKYTFRLLNIGEVRRIDFVAIVSTDNETVYFRSAFVHMYYMYESEISKDLMFCFNNNMQYKLWVDSTSFWWILKNYNPVIDTDLNIHQVVENARLLEERVVKQEDLVVRQAAQISHLQDIISKLISKIYHDETDEKDNESCSTHSSMPSLISAHEDDMDDSDDSAKNRIQFSADLCGNH